MEHNAVIEEIFTLYEKFGAEEYSGEPVSQLEHMSQSAQLAIQNKQSNEVILAAFFHDIGHLCVSNSEKDSMGGYGVKSHEKIGADYLRSKGFPEIIAQLVENHVEAKRYLTFKYPAYYHELSEASKQTLTYQGGIMRFEEAKAFENDPLFEASIMLRRWDELAKEVNVPCIDISLMKSLASKILNSNQLPSDRDERRQKE